jgi:hypothetical protein
MPEYFLPILLFACLLFHFVFGRARLRRMERIQLPLADKAFIKRFVSASITYSILTTSVCFLASLINSVMPQYDFVLFPMALTDSKTVDYFGIFLVKIAFISKVVVYFKISDQLSFEFNELNKEKIMRMELLIQSTTLLLSAGVLIFISSLILLAVFLSGACFFSYSKLRS